MKWDKVKLGNISTVDWGNTSLTKSSYVKDGEFLAVSAAGCDGRIAHFEHGPETTVISAIGANCGVVFFPNEKFTAIKNTMTVTPISGVIHPKYLYWFLSVAKFKIRGAGQPFLSKGDTEELLVSLPPIHIQQQIADTLDKADALRRKDQETLQKYDELAQAIFFDMFGDPIRNEKGWVKATLGKACTMIKDGPHASPKYVEQGVPFISVNNIIKGDWDLSKVKYISEEDHKTFSKRCNPTYGDVLYTKGGTTGYAKYVDVHWSFTNWVHIAVLKFDRSIINGRFLEYMLNTDHCYRQSQKYTRGIANRDLVLGEMKKIDIYIPPISIQDAFAVIVEKLLIQKSLQKKTADATITLYNTYLNEYLS